MLEKTELEIEVECLKQVLEGKITVKEYLADGYYSGKGLTQVELLILRGKEIEIEFEPDEEYYDFVLYTEDDYWETVSIYCDSKFVYGNAMNDDGIHNLKIPYTDKINLVETIQKERENKLNNRK